jgi:hypothetical protein
MWGLKKTAARDCKLLVAGFRFGGPGTVNDQPKTRSRCVSAMLLQHRGPKAIISHSDIAVNHGAAGDRRFRTRRWFDVSRSGAS